jgi:hypothetical protein
VRPLVPFSSPNPNPNIPTRGSTSYHLDAAGHSTGNYHTTRCRSRFHEAELRAFARFREQQRMICRMHPAWPLTALDKHGLKDPGRRLGCQVRCPQPTAPRTAVGGYTGFRIAVARVRTTAVGYIPHTGVAYRPSRAERRTTTALPRSCHTACARRRRSRLLWRVGGSYPSDALPRRPPGCFSSRCCIADPSAECMFQ